MKLHELRKEIDALDDKIVDLLCQRYELIREVGKLKAETGMAIVAPDRERDILNHVTSRVHGSLNPKILRSVYREIFRASYSVEKPVRAVYIGPELSFSQFAAQAQFGNYAETRGVADLRTLFSEVENGRADYGFAPIDNCMEYVYGNTKFALLKSNLKITRIVHIPASYALLSKSPISKINCIYANGQHFIECRDWLNTNLPNVEKFELTSTVQAAKLACEEEGVAVILNRLAIKHFMQLHVLADNIENKPGTDLTFAVLGKHSAAKTGHDVTRICVLLKDRVGTLADLLEVFVKAGMSIRRVESFKVDKTSDEESYCILDLPGHETDQEVQEVLEKIYKVSHSAKILGSFPDERLETR